jgi:hypothetical protein
LVQLSQRMPHPIDVRGQIRRQIGRAQERHFGPVVSSDIGREWGIGGDDHGGEHAAFTRRRDGVRNERMAGERAHVLSVQPLRSGTGRDQGDDGDGGVQGV